MVGALLYLRLTSLRNWVLHRVRRLRQPKYLIGAVVGCAYFYYFFFRGLGGSPRRGGLGETARHSAVLLENARATLPADWLPVTSALGALALLVIAGFMWVVPTRRAALGFSEAEIAFLFPAPVSRRALIHFRLLSGQLRSLLGAAVMMLFSNRWAVLGGNALTHAIGWWFIFSALNLHASGAGFTLTRLADLGLRTWWRRLLVLGALAAIMAATIALLPAGTFSVESGDVAHPLSVTGWLVTLSETAPLAWLLWPIRIVLGPFLAVDGRHFLMASGPALALIGLHYLWVVKTAVAFEEASLEHAERRSARLAAWRSGRRQPAKSSPRRTGPFRLTDVGRPELAFLWKNLLSTWPYFTPRVWLACSAAITAGCVWLDSLPGARPALAGIGAVAVTFAAYVLVVGPQFARQDIRSDLIHADILKTYPLPGWQLILGELLAPVAILTGILWIALLAAVLAFHPTSATFAWLTPAMRVVATGGLALIAPFLVTLQLLVPNAAALVFPAWFQLTRTRGGGPEVVGQRMIYFFAQLVAMALALVPATGAAALVILAAHWLVGPVVAVALGSLAALVVLGAEVAGGVWFLGTRFEKLDISSELRSSP